MKAFFTRRNIIIGVVALLALCCIGSYFAAQTADDEPEEVVATSRADEVAVSEEAESETPSDDAPTSTNEPEPTDVPDPTDTPEPTNTPAPTDTPAPTNTPTPVPTNTPIPTPTNTPEPIILTGAGDSLVSIDKGSEPALVRITGNASSRHFAVSNYDAAGNSIDLLVNTTEPYEGVRPLDFRNGEHTAEFEISATGDWTIEVIPLGSIERITVPGEITGNGDYVFALAGAAPGRATISGNSAARHFAVIAYGSSSIDLLVNTVDPYEGTVRLASDVIIIEVSADGEWTITIE